MRSRASSYALIGLLSVPAVALGVGGLLAGSAAAAEGECGGKPVTVDLSVEGQAPTEGDDVIVVPAAVSVDALGGNDTICVLGEGTADIVGGLGDDTIHVRYGNRVNAGAGNDTMSGDFYTLDAGPGNDTIHAGKQPGPAFLAAKGGDGDDTFHAGSTRSAFNGQNGVDTFFGGPAADYAAGGAGDDRLHGAEGGDSLQGDGGADLVEGGVGDDDLRGGADADTLLGGAGADYVTVKDVDAAGDVIDAGSADTAVDELDLRPDIDFTSSVTGVELDMASGATNWGASMVGFESVVGTKHADAIIGTDSVDTIDGDGGDDAIDGGLGDDTIQGNLGNDTIRGGGGADTIKGYDGSDTIGGGDWRRHHQRRPR